MLLVDCSLMGWKTNVQEQQGSCDLDIASKISPVSDGDNTGTWVLDGWID